MDYSQDLFEEFDVFSVQIKSTLDHLVSALRPMIGRKWTMCTFGGKGETVLNSLKRSTGRKHEGRVRMMEHLLFRDQHRTASGVRSSNPFAVRFASASTSTLRMTSWCALLE